MILHCSLFLSWIDRIENLYAVPEASAFVNKFVVNGMVLINIVIFLIPEYYQQGVGIRVLNHGTVSICRLTNMELLNFTYL